MTTPNPSTMIWCSHCGYHYDMPLNCLDLNNLRDRGCEPCATLARVLDSARLLHQVPPYMHPGVIRFVMNGVMPGSFLEAVFKDSLGDSLGQADEQNRACIFEWACVMYQMPMNCRRTGVDSWAEAGGLVGIYETAVAAKKEKEESNGRKSTTDG